MSSFRFDSYSRPLGRRHDQDSYAWCVFLDAGRKELGSIRHVQYTLPRSFPNPVRVVSDAAHCFALESRGWGAVEIGATVVSNDGRVAQTRFKLRLRGNRWPLGPQPAEFESAAAEKICRALTDGQWDWRTLSALARRAGVSAAEAAALLGRMARKRLVRAAYFKSLDDDDLWGATCRVGLLPEPK